MSDTPATPAPAHVTKDSEGYQRTKEAILAYVLEKGHFPSVRDIKDRRVGKGSLGTISQHLIRFTGEMGEMFQAPAPPKGFPPEAIDLLQKLVLIIRQEEQSAASTLSQEAQEKAIAAIHSLQDALRDLELARSDIQKLESQLAARDQGLVKAQADARALADQIEGFNHRMHHLRDQLQAAQQANIISANQAADTKAALANAQGRITGHEAEITRLQASVGDYQQLLKVAQDENQAKDQRVLAMEIEKRGLETELQSVRTQLRQAQEKAREVDPENAKSRIKRLRQVHRKR